MWKRVKSGEIKKKQTIRKKIEKKRRRKKEDTRRLEKEIIKTLNYFSKFYHLKQSNYSFF